MSVRTFSPNVGRGRGDNGASRGLAGIRGSRATLLTANASHLRDYGIFGCRTDREPLFADAPHFGDATFGLRIFVRCFGTREQLLHRKHTSRRSWSVHGVFKNEVWPFAGGMSMPLRENFDGVGTMLASSRTVADQGCQITFSNGQLRGVGGRLTLRHAWWPWTSFRLGSVFSSLGACLGRKRRAAAPIASPGVVLCALPGFASSQGTGGRRAKSRARAGYELVLSTLLATIALFTASTVSTHAQITNWTGNAILRLV